MFESVKKFIHNIRRKKVSAAKRDANIARHFSRRMLKKLEAAMLHKQLVKLQQANGLESRAKRKQLFRRGELYPNQKKAK